MTTIQLNQDFAFNFYPDSSMYPEIRHFTEGFYDVDGVVSLSYDDAKKMIAALQNFVDTVDAAKRKHEANDQIFEKSEEYNRGLQELLAQADVDEKKRRQEANDQISMSMGYL